jgi:SAM-dependent methyltransferase
MSTGDYAFASDTTAGYQHHQLLAELDDGPTIGRILRRLPAGLRDMRIWIPGCGNGNLARNLSEYVGPQGRVIATDRDITRFGQRGAVDVRRLDLVNDPPPEGTFDLIHVRRVLSHLPEREAIVPMLIECLSPGGHIGLEDWVHPQQPLDMLALVPEPVQLNHSAYCEFQYAVWRILDERGHDRRFGMDTYEYLDAFDLEELESGTESTMWPGGSPGCLLQDVTLTELDAELAEHGVSRGTKQTVRRLFHDPRFVIRGNPTYWTWGRKPKAA